MSAQPLTFAEFYPRYLPPLPTPATYPCYLREHSRRGTRVLHFVGTTLFVICLMMLLRTSNWNRRAGGVVAAYGFAWVGHFFVEHNRPATFQHPWFSLLGDFRMYFDPWRGREKF